MKTKKLSLISLIVAFALCVAGAIVSLTPVKVASAATSYNPTSLFTESTTGSIKAEAGQPLEFTFAATADNSVGYNRDLAYKWFTQKGDAGYFSMEFAFGELKFDSFTLAFQSAENNITDEELAENKIVFEKEGSAYSVSVLNHKGEATAEGALDLTKDITVSFGEAAALENRVSGEFIVTVTDGTSSVAGKFTNIGGNFAEASVDLLPLSMEAEIGQDLVQSVYMKSMNGQSFILDNSETPRIVDNAAPVLVINDDIKSFTIGAKLLDFTYEVIDVCASTVSKTMKYYQYQSASETVEEADYSSLTTTVRIWDGDVFRSGIDGIVDANGDKITGTEYVSIVFSLSDGNGNSAKYDVSWYAYEASDVVTLAGGEGSVDYLRVILDEESPYYTCIDFNDAARTQTLNENAAYQAYVAAVADAAKDIYAGEGYKFYLPSLEDLIRDDETTYTGLSFTVFYKSDGNSSTSTLSSLDYDSLSIPVSKTGRYMFKVVASDKTGNGMFFWLNDGWVSVSSGNIWDVEAIPTFSFSVESNGIRIEDTKTLTYASVGTNYSVDKYEIKGVSGYETKYSLYYLDGVGLGNIPYKDIVNFVNDCYNNGVDISTEAKFIEELEKKIGELGNAKPTSTELTKISPWDDKGPQDEEEEGWSTHDNRYVWKTSSLSFTPQESGYYVVRMELVDSSIPGERLTAYKVVYVASEADEFYGDDYWIENNVVTVVFIVLAAVSAIAIVVIWITAPSQETVEGGKGKGGKEGSSRTRRRRNDSEK